MTENKLNLVNRPSIIIYNFWYFVFEVKNKIMNKTKTIVALHLLAVVVAAGVAMMTEEKVFAQPATPNTTNAQVVDQPDQPDSQSQTNNMDNHSDGETNDDNNANEVTSGDGEQSDQTEK